MKVQYWQHNLKFRHPFTISKGTKTHQPTLIVELEHFGIKGYGEASAIAYYKIPVEKMIEDVEQKKQFIETLKKQSVNKKVRNGTGITCIIYFQIILF